MSCFATWCLVERRLTAPSAHGTGCLAAATAKLNLAQHIVVLTQVRMRASRGHTYYDTKITAGKTHNEAMLP